MDEKEILEQTVENVTETPVSDELNETVEMQEFDVENNENIELEVVDTEDEENTDASYETAEDDVYRESVPEEEIQVSVEPEKKPLGLQKPIVIACCILLAAIIAFGGLFAYNTFFGASVVGTWVLSGEEALDEPKIDGNGVTYFTFDKDGKASMTIGTMSVVGEWAYNTTDAEPGERVVDVSISYFFNGTFTVTAEGNTFVGKTLNLSSDAGKYDFVSTTIPEMYPAKKDDGKIDEKLVGQWENADQGNVYTFNTDGTCVIEQASTLVIDGRFTVDDGKIVLSYIANEEVETEMEYKIQEDGTVVIENLEYTKK